LRRSTSTGCFIRLLRRSKSSARNCSHSVTMTRASAPSAQAQGTLAEFDPAEHLLGLAHPDGIVGAHGFWRLAGWAMKVG
jgi:hypothetical protein